MKDCNKLDKRTKLYKDCIKANLKQPIGLGDVVETITKKTGIKKVVKFLAGEDCGCEERKEKWNEIKLFSQRLKARCLTEDEYNSWTEFKEVRTLKLSDAQVKYVCKIYADVFGRLYWEPCRGCSPKPLINMIDNLDKVHASYE